jgi:hypothetical protein
MWARITTPLRLRVVAHLARTSHFAYFPFLNPNRGPTLRTAQRARLLESAGDYGHLVQTPGFVSLDATYRAPFAVTSSLRPVGA